MTTPKAAASQALPAVDRPALPQAFFLDAPHGGQRFCLFHAPRPGAAERGRVVFCHPFAEELNTTRRTVARQARAMAEAGFAVLLIDLLGCGDSSGDFEEASWPAWLADLALGHHWLCQQPFGGPLWLWGMRAGALLASDLAAALPEPVNLLLWQPTPSGQQQLQQFLRLHAAGQWLASATMNTKTDKQNTPAQQLAQGLPVHIAGYTLSPLLAQGLAATRLQAPAHQPPGRLVWLELGTQTAFGPATEKQLAIWQHAGWQVAAQVVTTPAFWQTVDTEAAPELISATLAALTAAPAEPASAAGAHKP